MKQWDGVYYQTWTQFIIIVCIIGLLIDRFTAPNDGGLFVTAILFLIAAIFMVPEGLQPPKD